MAYKKFNTSQGRITLQGETYAVDLQNIKKTDQTRVETFTKAVSRKNNATSTDGGAACTVPEKCNNYEKKVFSFVTGLDDVQSESANGPLDDQELPNREISPTVLETAESHHNDNQLSVSLSENIQDGPEPYLYTEGSEQTSSGRDQFHVDHNPDTNIQSELEQKGYEKFNGDIKKCTAWETIPYWIKMKTVEEDKKNTERWVNPGERCQSKILDARNIDKPKQAPCGDPGYVQLKNIGINSIHATRNCYVHFLLYELITNLYRVFDPEEDVHSCPKVGKSCIKAALLRIYAAKTFFPDNCNEGHISHITGKLLRPLLQQKLETDMVENIIHTLKKPPEGCDSKLDFAITSVVTLVSYYLKRKCLCWPKSLYCLHQLFLVLIEKEGTDNCFPTSYFKEIIDILFKGHLWSSTRLPEGFHRWRKSHEILNVTTQGPSFKKLYQIK